VNSPEGRIRDRFLSRDDFSRSRVPVGVEWISIVFIDSSSTLNDTLLPLDWLLLTRDLRRTLLPPGIAGDEGTSGESGGNVALDRLGSYTYGYGCEWCVGVE